MEGKQFIYQRIYNSLRSDILAGKYAYESVLPSERLLSETYGVWRTTVRQALDLLADEGLVEKRAGIGTRVLYGRQDTAADIPVQDNVIGIFIAGDMTGNLQTEQPYYSDLLYYMDMECKSRGCRFIFTTVNSRSDIENLMHNNFMLVIYLSHTNFEYLEVLREFCVPVMLLNEEYQNYPLIANDQVSSGYLAINYLLKMGHRRIGIITGPLSHLTVKRRLAGCYLALSEYNIPNPAGDWLQVGKWEYESGYDATVKMFSGGSREGHPTALFAFNDIMGIGALRALRDMGYDIPNDISVIGSDNIRQLAYTEPGLTTIDMNTRYTANAIVTCALNGICSNFAPGTNVITPVELVVRNTVKDLNQQMGK